MSLPDRTIEYRCLNTLLAGLQRWLPDPLNAERLLASAQRSTGLSDFGDSDFLEPYRLVLQDLCERAQLTPLGCQILRRSVLGFLENRLCLQAFWRSRASLERVPLQRPLYVVGFPRSGTTLLFNVMAQHADARSLRLWEAMQPAPRFRRGRPCRADGRIAHARQIAWFMHRQAPRLRTQHPLQATEPEESTWLLSNTFMSPAFSMQAYVPRYQDWLRLQTPERWQQAYAYYRRTLQGLQNQESRQHWVLRSPAHLRQLGVFLEMLPEARVVLPIRDPANVVGSYCSLLATVRGLSSNRTDLLSIGREVLEGLATAWDDAAASLQRFASRVAIVMYDDVVNDPARLGAAIYSHFGYPVPANYESRIRNWVATHQPDRFGTHRYRLEDFGLSPGQVRERLANYATARADL